MVDEHKPDLIIGCETHLDETYTNREKCFHKAILLLGKDRCYGGGGVFLAVSLNISFLDLSITTDAEMVWVKISPVHGEPISICSFYRPPDSNVNPITDLKTVLGTYDDQHYNLSWRF